jgi:hypothetical protein
MSRKEGFQAVFVTIDEGRVWIYEPVGKPTEREWINGIRNKRGAATVATDMSGSNGKDRILVKAYDVNHLPMRRRTGEFTAGVEGIPTSEVPLILSSMKVNQAFSRNTFTEINKDGVGRYTGNIAAIKTVLGESGDGFTVDPLDCLSAVEFETLVAKLFEAQNCFVPAYRGGVMKDVDLTVHTEGAIESAWLRLRRPEAGSVMSVQLKLSAANDALSLDKWLSRDPRNVLISLDTAVPSALVAAHGEGRFLGRSDIRDWVNKSSTVKAWLNRSLDWLRPEWRKDEREIRGQVHFSTGDK